MKTLNVLREAIIAGRLAPGQKLIERDLCEQTGVSRSSIREALRNLESERLVESLDTKGVVVATLTPEIATEIYEIRAALDSEAALHFAQRATSEDLAELEDTFNALKNTPVENDEAFLAASNRFYAILYQGARNETAKHVMQLLGARISLLRATTTRRSPVERRHGTVELMGEIFKALKKRDGNAAALTIRALIERSAQSATALLKDGQANR
ncbi:GntR family transcriptional regulator [Paraburkholderia sp. Ac-20336]|uniref:GntR family transcriptional regulator n=1 Tax=Burkholderiaceae TaxID=119060 RepID=UPI00141FF9AD|nr:MULTISPECIES: GntR family transcriptional regulator [Burkholderiaceae]MBN3801701.1 GntR family transcriptional regulator [Paraburkholderia sp. Ac-20336]MBN3845645.1 GntR family transcriptional regulator [Paraburkholderia sp. Ac-20342]